MEEVRQCDRSGEQYYLYRRTLYEIGAYEIYHARAYKRARAKKDGAPQEEKI
jgi:hypothetical protein